MNSLVFGLIVFGLIVFGLMILAAFVTHILFNLSDKFLVPLFKRCSFK
jgi:hypothetical protein